MMDDSQKEIINNQIRNLDAMETDIALSIEQLSEKYNKADFREMLLLILLKRALKFFKSYIILIRNDQSEPAMALVRSIFEANLLIRWCLIDPENVKQYVKEGMSSARKMLDNLKEKKYYPDAKQKEIEEALNKMSSDNLSYTQWRKMATSTGMTEIFDLVYPVLSAMAHGSLMSISGQIENKDISADSDFTLISASIPLANNFSSDCHILCAEWLYSKKIRPIPNLRDLLTELEVN